MSQRVKKNVQGHPAATELNLWASKRHFRKREEEDDKLSRR
jgi:hypothetical protein